MRYVAFVLRSETETARRSYRSAGSGQLVEALAMPTGTGTRSAGMLSAARISMRRLIETRRDETIRAQLLGWM